MEVAIEDILDEAKIMAFELRIKDRQIAYLKNELAKKADNEHTTERGGPELGSGT